MKLLSSLMLLLCLGTSLAHAALAPAQVGRFEALLMLDSAYAGKISVATTSKNAFTGSLIIGAKATALKGQVTQDGAGLASATLKVAGTAPKSTVRIAFTIAPDGVFACTVADNANSQVLGEGGGEKIIPPSISILNTLKGSYTVLWTFTDSNAATYEGHAYATAKIDPTGLLTLTGKTVDGKTFTSASYIDSDLTTQVFASPYSVANTYFAGSLKFSRRSDGLYHVTGKEDGVFTFKGPPDNRRPTGWGPATMTAWMEPWRFTSRAAFWKSLGWSNEPLIAVAIGANGSDSGLRGRYYAIPRTAQLDRGYSLAPKDFYSNFTLEWNKWRVQMTPSTGLFTGSYDTYDTLETYQQIKITRTHHNVIGGVFMQPDPSAGIKGGGYGAVVNPPNSSFDAIYSKPITLTEK